MTKIISINSRDRDINLYPKSNNFRIQLNNTYKDVTVMRLVSCMLLNSNYNVSTNKNTIIFTIDGVSTSCTIPVGYYETLTEFSNALKASLESGATAVSKSSTFTITEENDGKIKIVNNTYDFTLNLSSSSFTLPKILLGYYNGCMTDASSTTSTLYSAIPPDVLYQRYYYIKIHNIDNVIKTSNNNLQANFLIPITSNKQTRNTLYSSYELINRFNPLDLSYFEVSLLDENNDLVDIMSDWTFVVEIAE